VSPASTPWENGPPLLSMEGISKAFPGVQALEGVSFRLRAGEIHALVGENGAGKSTLMKILGGIHRPDEGIIRIEGKACSFQGPRDAEAAGVALIHQELSLFPELSVKDNLFLGREITGPLGILDKGAMRKKAEALLARLDLDKEISPETRLGDLSLGRRQEIEILKALGLEARILVMDEPTSALSDTEVERLFAVVRRLADQGVGVIYISHRLDEIFRLCRRVTVLRDGKLAGSGPMEEMDRAGIIRMMVGREAGEYFRPTPHRPGREVLRVEGACLEGGTGGRRRLVEDVSFSVRAGEVVGLAGLLGAGRTELLEGIFGARGGRFRGKVFLEGKPVTISSPREARARGLALVTEDRARLGIFPDFDVTRNLTISSLSRFVRGGILRKSLERRAALDAVEDWNLRVPSPETSITALSGGNQQKIILARWMLTEPKVIFLDEPTRGIDVGAKAEIYNRIDHLARRGLGIVVVSSELPELLALADRVLVLCEGRLTAAFDREEASPEKVMAAAAPGGLEMET